MPVHEKMLGRFKVGITGPRVNGKDYLLQYGCTPAVALNLFVLSFMKIFSTVLVIEQT